jgi:uncharacterized integral membrane protein
MVRVLVLLVIVGGLTIFALQNTTPIALVILATQTQALPIAVWVIGAIAAGALTTLVISWLFSASAAASFRRYRVRLQAQHRTTGRFSGTSADRYGDTGWSTVTDQATATANASSKTSASRDRESDRYSTQTTAATSRREETNDWETFGKNLNDNWEKAEVNRAREHWEEWESAAEPAAPPRATYSRAPRPGYQTFIQMPEEEPVSDREEWEEWDGYEEDDDEVDGVDEQSYPSDERYIDSPPRRTEFEMKQEPKASYRSGSMYSYTYRTADESADDDESGGVYDAEYRVITPPYRPDPEEVEPFDETQSEDAEVKEWQTSQVDEEDWDDDDWENKGDRPRNHQ